MLSFFFFLLFLDGAVLCDGCVQRSAWASGAVCGLPLQWSTQVINPRTTTDGRDSHTLTHSVMTDLRYCHLLSLNVKNHRLQSTSHAV